MLAATDTYWDCTGPLPVPRPGWLLCPVCGSAAVVVRFWRFHTRPDGATVPRRCDVSVKCAACAAVWPHGIAIGEDTWSRRFRHPSRLMRALALGLVEPTLWAGRGGVPRCVVNEAVR